MPWIDAAIARLAGQAAWGYQGDTPAATEPTALAALALIGHGHPQAAQPALEWLGQRQNADGSVGIDTTQAEPGWPTSLAVLAWASAEPRSPAQYAENIRRGVAWLLDAQGVPLPRMAILGHDSTLIGWPWVVSTHSWLEPTAWAVLALNATGQGQHLRALAGIQVLLDRMLPTGGCNYGNTFVLGQKLRPQLEPTGLALMALAKTNDPAGRIDASCDYLSRGLTEQTPPISLSYGLLGLAAQDRPLAKGTEWIDAAAQKALRREPDALKLALLLLAALGTDCPLLIRTQNKQGA